MFGFDINLQEFPLVDVLQFLVRVKKSGVLRIIGAVSGDIYLRNGSVVHATDSVNKGIEALLNLSFTDQKTGRFECGVIAPEQTLAEDFGKLTETIERRRIEFREIKKKLPSLSTVLAKSTKELGSTVALRRTDWQMLALIDGKRKLGDVITESKIGGYEATKTITWLRQQGLIYDPKEAERIMSRFIEFLGILFKVFGENGFKWLKQWGDSNTNNRKLIDALDINKETLEIKPRAELSSREITELLEDFRNYVKIEGPKIYGKVLFKKKLKDFEQKAKYA